MTAEQLDAVQTLLNTFKNNIVVDENQMKEIYNTLLEKK